MTAPRFILRAVPERAKFIKPIKAQIPGLEVVFDKTRNAMDTFCSALEHAGQDAAVHLEDDVILCSDFVTKVTAAVAERPNKVIQFFSRSKEDVTKGSRWRPGSSFSMNQCFYLPPGLSALLLDYRACWPRIKEHPTGYDLMMADYFAAFKLRYWNHVPSLVQHAEAVSLIDRRRSSRRQSATFQG